MDTYYANTISLVIGFCLLLSVVGCRSGGLSDPLTVPKPQPVHPVDSPEAAINKILAHADHPMPAMHRRSRVQDTLSTQTVPEQGVICRKELANWLIRNTAGGMPRLARGDNLFDDMTTPADAKLAYTAAMSPWAPAFFPQGRGDHFFPEAPVNREQFCMLAAILAGQYSSLRALSEETMQHMAPPPQPGSPDALPFSDALDYLQISPVARPSVGWAYQELLLNRAFNLNGTELADQGIHPGQSIRWEEVRTVLLYLLERSGQYQPGPTPGSRKLDINQSSENNTSSREN